MNKTIVWALFITITLMQMQGNMYYAFQNLTEYSGWVELFDLIEEDVNTQKRILAFVSGAILPLVALGFIKSLVDYIKPEEVVSSEKKEEKSEYEKALQDFKGEESIDTEEMIKKNEEMLATSSLSDEYDAYVAKEPGSWLKNPPEKKTEIEEIEVKNAEELFNGLVEEEQPSPRILKKKEVVESDGRRYNTKEYIEVEVPGAEMQNRKVSIDFLEKTSEGLTGPKVETRTLKGNKDVNEE
jgi:hypothetical protein